MNSVVYFFGHIQLIYLLYLTITNLSTTIMTWITLKQMIMNYFYANDVVLEELVGTDAFIPISILAPAFNEEQTIVSSVHSLLKVKYQLFEVVIINDGSTDNTMARLIESFDLYESQELYDLELEHKPIRKVYKSKLYKKLIVVDKENGRKSDALNVGINISKYPLICCVDADTILEEDALTKSAQEFLKDRRVIAAGAAIGITNGSKIENHTLIEKRVPNNLIESFQILEYLRGFFAGRVGWQPLNGLILISGAFGVFDKKLIKKIGGYRHAIGEDFDLLLRLRKYCYQNGIDHTIGFVPEALCWTQCPADYDSLLKQRNRWQRGLLECLLYHKDMMFNPKYKTIGLITMPYFLIVEALGPVITFVGILSILVFYFVGYINATTMTLFFLLEFVWGISLNIISLYLEIFAKHAYKGMLPFFKLFLLGFIEPFFYKPLLKAELFIATFNVRNTNWGEIKRKAL
jgi:cellulose synthase/poly-beta-1,6-N-acetylglucosamine synthase-like glycosyltransferase